MTQPLTPEQLDEDGIDALYRDDVREILEAHGWRETAEDCVVAENGALWTETNTALDSGVDASDKAWSVSFDSDVPASVIAAVALVAAGTDLLADNHRLRQQLDEARTDAFTEAAEMADRLSMNIEQAMKVREIGPLTALQDLADELRRAAGEQPPADEEPTPLRWGLDDVLYGDDDHTIVMLSGPDGEPYWLDLDPERTASLRQALAGPDAEDDAADDFTGTRPCGHDDYHDPHEWADQPSVWCPGISFADDEPAPVQP